MRARLIPAPSGIAFFYSPNEVPMQLLDGKATSDQLKKEIAEKVAAIKAAGGRVPHLAAVLVVLSLFALLGCPGDDDDDDDDGAAVFDLTSVAVPVSSTTVAAVQGQAISLPAGTYQVRVQVGGNLTFERTIHLKYN